jgi:antitoxin component HigA of HigAB toxin-antitoxin module
MSSMWPNAPVTDLTSRPLAKYSLETIGEIVTAAGGQGEIVVMQEIENRSMELASAAADFAISSIEDELRTQAAERLLAAFDSLGLTDRLLDHLVEMPTPGFVKRRLQLSGMSQKDLAAAVGLKVPHASQILNGKRKNPKALHDMLKVIQSIQS